MDELQLIQSKIYEIRGQKVMLDFDLAEMYEVETRVLNQAVKRNIERFPEDFMFQLTKDEWQNMRVSEKGTLHFLCKSPNFPKLGLFNLLQNVYLRTC